MNYYGAKELANSHRTVRKNTIVIAEEIAEKDYAFRAAPDVRTVGQTLVHIALTTRLQHHIHAVEHRTTLEGFDFPSFFARLTADEQAPRNKAQIIDFLRRHG